MAFTLEPAPFTTHLNKAVLGFEILSLLPGNFLIPVAKVESTVCPIGTVPQLGGFCKSGTAHSKSQNHIFFIATSRIN